MKWFGRKSWGAPVCIYCERVDVPVGEECPHCLEKIVDRDEGFIVPLMGQRSKTEKPWHRECFLYMVQGKPRAR
jgi:hypothetical protein